MAVDLNALKAQLVDQATMEAVTKVDWTTEAEETKDASVVATNNIWLVIADLEQANAELADAAVGLSRLARLTTQDPRYQAPKQAKSPYA